MKFSPVPLSIQRKELRDAQSLYNLVRQSMEQGQSKLIELTCEKVQDKKVSVLSTDVVAVQIYEKAASSGGVKRPGFSFDS